MLGKHAIQRGATSLVLAGAVLGVGLAAGTIRLRDERCRTWCGESNAGTITMAFSMFTAVSGQLAAAGARNGRRGGGHGIPALRAVAWTSYVLAIGAAFGMLVATLAAEWDVIPSPAIFATGTLAGTSLACFGVNAIIAGRQAQARVKEERRTIGPALGLWRESHTDAIRPSLGVRMTY